MEKYKIAVTKQILRLSTVDLLIKSACFVKKCKIMFTISKATDQTG
jgi:hypothetical protein